MKLDELNINGNSAHIGVLLEAFNLSSHCQSKNEILNPRRKSKKNNDAKKVTLSDYKSTNPTVVLSQKRSHSTTPDSENEQDQINLKPATKRLLFSNPPSSSSSSTSTSNSIMIEQVSASPAVAVESDDLEPAIEKIVLDLNDMELWKESFEDNFIYENNIGDKSAIPILETTLPQKWLDGDAILNALNVIINPNRRYDNARTLLARGYNDVLIMNEDIDINYQSVLISNTIVQQYLCERTEDHERYSEQATNKSVFLKLCNFEGNHWFSLVYDKKKQLVLVYDSIPRPLTEYDSQIQMFVWILQTLYQIPIPWDVYSCLSLKELKKGKIAYTCDMDFFK